MFYCLLLLVILFIFKNFIYLFVFYKQGYFNFLQLPGGTREMEDSDEILSLPPPNRPCKKTSIVNGRDGVANAKRLFHYVRDSHRNIKRAREKERKSTSNR